MLIREFALDNSANSQEKLLALAVFLKDRAQDENARAEISQAAFIELAQDLKVNVTPDNLADMIASNLSAMCWNPWNPIPIA